MLVLSALACPRPGQAVEDYTLYRGLLLLGCLLLPIDLPEILRVLGSRRWLDRGGFL